MNVYSDSSHTVLKYLKDTKVNMRNTLIMTGNFNIRDHLWDPSFPYHSSISDELIIIVDSFNLSLSNLANSCPTRYLDTSGDANSVLDLMFLRSDSLELDSYYIHPESRLLSDHAPLSIEIHDPPKE